MMIERLSDLPGLAPATTRLDRYAGGGLAFGAALTGTMAAQAGVAIEACERSGEDDEGREARRRDRAARQTGVSLLDALSELQRAMVSGEAAQDPLDRLSVMLQHVPQATDPDLAQVMRAVVLRSRIELHRRC